MLETEEGHFGKTTMTLSPVTRTLSRERAVSWASLGRRSQHKVHVDRSQVCNGRLRRDPVLGQPTPGSAGGVLRKPGTIPVIFPLFPLFPLFFDGTEMQYCWKNWLVVKVRSLRAGLWLQYSTYVLYWQIRKVLRNGMLTHTPIHPEYQGRGEASHHELSASPQCIIDRRFAPTIKISHWPVLESWTFFVPTTSTQPAIP